MLPPLNLAESKTSGFFSRKRIDRKSSIATVTASPLTARRQTTTSLHSTSSSSSSSSTSRPRESVAAPLTPRNGYSNSSSSFQSPAADAIPAVASSSSAVSPVPPSKIALDDISVIPREFFVFETHAVLPVTQFPPTQYQSRFLAHKSLWETLVFPALSPQTRQQVLFLRQTLAKMRAALLGAAPSCSVSEDQKGLMQVVEFTKAESHVYSLCFHELIRQIKYICREQSELLFEIREYYDAVLSRIIAHVVELQTRVEKQQTQISDLVSQHDQALRSNDSLLEQALRTQSIQEQALMGEQQRVKNSSSRTRQRRRREGGEGGRKRWRCCECQREDQGAAANGSDGGENNEDNDSDDDDDGDSDCSEDDEEEREWRRQRRRNCRQLDAIRRSRKRDSIGEENLAAARLQSAYHKYHLRKEQHRLALREEKHIAALEIQRSYRGFRQRQLALHRRAVVQVILKRRKEAAAIELLQANVRSYLLKQKKEESRKLKRSAAAAAAALRADRSEQRGVDDGGSNGDPSAVGIPEGSEALRDGRYSALLAERAREDPTATLMSFLNKFSDLANAISELQSRDEAANNNSSTQFKPTDRESSPTPDGSSRYEGSSSASHETSEKGGDGDPNRQIEDKIKQAEELVCLFHAAIASLKESSLGYDDASLDGNSPQTKGQDATDVGTAAELTILSQSTSTSSLDLHFLPFDVFAALNEQENGSDHEHKESVVSHSGNSNTRETSKSSVVMTHPGIAATDGDRRLSSMASPLNLTTAALSERKEAQQHNGDFDLDETRWNAELNAIQLNESGSTQMRNAELLSKLLASSRDTKKKFVWLKQFISDAYDTIVGKLKELPLQSMQSFVRARCSLAMSIDEWHNHHHHQRRSHGDNVGASSLGAQNDPVAASLASISLAEIIHEHFHCQLGLKHLVASALANLATCLDNFKAIDPDVKRFHAFLNLEKSHDELLFFCMCRLFASQGSDNGGVFSTPGGSPAAAGRRQPVFHPETMRELIDLPQALRVAKSHFRVDDEAAIQIADAGLVEIENAVYKRYQPSSAFSQFEAVLSGYYLTVDPQAHGRLSDPADTCEGLGLDSPENSQCTRQQLVGSSPRLLANLPPGSMVRPSNVNQFHSKQFHAVAARSPLVRRHHQKSPVPEPYQTGRGDALVQVKWVHFDDFVDLLVKYRSEMNHFHLFTHWARELYSTATVTAAVDSSASLDYPGGAVHPSPQLLSDALFVDALLPYSLGHTERELTNIFHNALKQRSLQQWMPPRVFVSVVLLMLRNGLLSVSNFRSQAHSSSAKPPGQGKSQSIRGQNEDKRWMRLALKWRTQEAEFEKVLEAIYESPCGNPTAAATRLLELRNELYKLFIGSSGSKNLQRAEELYDQITMGLAHAKGQERIDITSTFDYDGGSDEEEDWGDDSSAREEEGVRDDRNHAEELSEGSVWSENPSILTYD